jgi:phosphomevalonate kinase
MYEAEKHSIWIVSDCRRKSDVVFFKNNFPSSVCKHVRVETPDAVRADRGFVFTAGIDDAETECGFDDVAPDYFDFQVINDSVKKDDELLRDLLLDVRKCLEA